MGPNGAVPNARPRCGRAIGDVATGGSLRDPSIVQALVNPGTSVGDLSPAEEELLLVMREEQGETLSRLRGGAAAKLRKGRHIGETETLDVTVLVSDIRGYSTIAEHADPSVFASQLNEHRAR